MGWMVVATPYTIPVINEDYYYFNHNVLSFLLWASTSAAIQPGLSSSNVLCFIAIVAIVSFEQMNHCH